MSAGIQEASVLDGVKPAAYGRPEPNFFIVGAAKAGTTSLTEYLRQHPDVFMPGGDLVMKEPSHFADPIPPWQEKYRDYEKYLALFADAGDRKAIGEASQIYFGMKGTEDRIHARAPHARIIIMLRNPADRVYSWYNFMCQFGIEPGPTLERALADEDKRLANEELKCRNWFWYFTTMYYQFGLCASHIERFMRRFPSEQVHVMLFDDLRKRPKETTQAVFEFLGVDPAFTPTFDVHNPTRAPLSVSAQHFLARNWRQHVAPMRAGRARLIDRYVIRAALDANMALGALRKRKFNPATRRELLERYRDDIRQTEQLIGRSLAHWLR